MTLITETVTINSKNYKHIYSDAGYYVKRNDNKLFMDVLEPTSSTYTYTETTQLATQQLLSRMMARMSTLEGLPHVVETYSNGTDWYRVYSDKWLEIGGYIKAESSHTTSGVVTFKKAFKDTNYCITMASNFTSGLDGCGFYLGTYNIKSNNQFTYNLDGSDYIAGFSWMAVGFIK